MERGLFVSVPPTLPRTTGELLCLPCEAITVVRTARELLGGDRERQRFRVVVFMACFFHAGQCCNLDFISPECHLTCAFVPIGPYFSDFLTGPP